MELFYTGHGFSSTNRTKPSIKSDLRVRRDNLPIGREISEPRIFLFPPSGHDANFGKNRALKNYFFPLFTMVIMSTSVAAQEYDFKFSGDFEYSLVSGIGNTDMRAYGIGLSTDFQKKSNAFGFGIGYTNHRFFYYGPPMGFEEAAFDQFHTFGLGVSYRHSMGRYWSIKAAFSPLLSSNFLGPVTKEDVIPGGSLVLSKFWKRETGLSQLSVGATYGVLLGSPNWYPELSYRYVIFGNWSFVIGFPETAVTYFHNERHQLKMRARAFGLYANNSDTMNYTGFGLLTDTKLRYNGTDVGLEHNYDMATGFTTAIRIGYQYTRDFEVMDNGGNIIHDLDPESTPYIMMGLKYKLN